MNLRQLEYFVAVAEERHFGRAAQRLHISQPPLSLQIKSLEEELGCSLLERTTRRVELTAAGEGLLLRARTLLSDLTSAARETQAIHRGEAGRLVLSFVGSATYELLPRVVRALRQELPGVDLGIETERLSPQQEEALLDGRIDVAVLNLIEGSTTSNLLSLTPLRTLPLVVAMPKGHRLARFKRITVSDLEDERFLMHPLRGSVLQQKVTRLCHRAGFQPKVAQEVRETITSVSLAAAGLGIAVLPEAVKALRVEGAIYRPLSGRTASVRQVLATRRGEKSPLIPRCVKIATRVARSVRIG